MDKKIKKLWVDALRSGEYKQGKAYLRRNGKFCCLGVLCNLHAQAHPEIAAQQKHKNEYMGESRVLPDEVVEWADLDDEVGGIVKIDGDTNSLACFNDQGVSFAKLADAIEKQL